MTEHIFQNYVYYRRNRDARLRYFHIHNKQWTKMKKFARVLGLRLPDARNYIDRRLRAWYIEVGLLETLPARQYSRRARTFIVPAERPQPLPDKGGPSLD